MVEIAGRLFKSKTDAKATYGSIRDNSLEGVALKGWEEKFIVECASAHVKIQGHLRENEGSYIRRVYISSSGAKNFKDRAVNVEIAFENGAGAVFSDTIGPKCVDFLFGKKNCKDAEEVVALYWKKKREEHARHAVDSDVSAFKESKRRIDDGKYECAACNRWVSKPNADVDHASPLFKTMLDEFCAANPACTLTPIDPLTPEWRAFHNARWNAQILCKPCHHDKSGGETSERARKKRERCA